VFTPPLIERHLGPHDDEIACAEVAELRRAEDAGRMRFGGDFLVVHRPISRGLRCLFESQLH
jgi:hypothetical protein